MRVRSFFAFAALMLTVGAMAGTARAAEPTETYDLDQQHSYVTFKVKHLGLNWSYGSFGHVEGSFTLDPGNPAASSFTIKVKAESVDTHVEKRDQHLRSPDFFNVKQFPWITYRSTKVAKTDKGYQVTGDLTLLGVTKPVTTDIVEVGAGKDPWGNYRTGLHAELVIKRSDFGMTWGVDNGVVGDEVRLTISVEGVRK